MEEKSEQDVFVAPVGESGQDLEGRYERAKILYEYIKKSGWIIREGIDKGKLNLNFIKVAMNCTKFDDGRDCISSRIINEEIYDKIIIYLINTGGITAADQLPSRNEAINYLAGTISEPPRGFYMAMEGGSKKKRRKSKKTKKRKITKKRKKNSHRRRTKNKLKQ